MSLALPLVTGQPFRMERIRAKRQKPGLLRQHLTAVEAVKIVGVDIGPNLLADARKRHPAVTFVQGSGEAPGLEPEIADLVTIATAFY